MLVKAKQAKPSMKLKTRLTLGLCLLGLVATAAQQFGWESLAVAKSWSRITSSQEPVGESRQLKLSSTSAAPGSEANLPLTFSADGTESRIHFSLRFPANALLKPRVALTDELAAAQLAVNDSLLAQGKLGLEINLPAGVTLTKGDHKILNVRFTIARQAGTVALPVEFGDEPVARGVWNDKAQSVSTGFVSAVVTSAPGLEGDVAPRPENGNGTLSVADWAQVGRFAAGLDSLNEGSEFQRTDCAPRTAAGDGQLNIADWVQAGRYAAGLDAPTMAGGPSAPVASIAATASTLAPEQQARVVRVVPATLNRGQQGNVALELTSQGNEFAVGFTLNFDPTQLAFVRAVAGSDATGASLIVNSNDAANGRIVFNLSLPFGQKFAAGARQVGVVTFTVRETSTLNSTTLSFSNGSVVDELAATLATTFTAGVVTLIPEINQTPRLTSLSPTTINVNSGNLTLTVNGANLLDGSIVRVNGQERATQYINASQLRATLQSTDAEEPGSLSITVRTPDNVVTNALTLNVVNPLPTITSINPNSAQTLGSGFAMTITGMNFVPGAVAKVGTTNRITNVLSSTQITVQIPNSALNTAGTFDVTVTNPAPGGGTSNAVPFTVSSPKPIPRIASISPTSKQGGTGAFTLTVTGSGFVNESIVRWNGADRVTTFVNATQLTAAITADDIATAGTASVTVYNSPPGGGISAAQTFTITQPPNPVPVLTTLNPTTITAGGAGFTLTLLGSNFVQNSVIRIGGQDRQTTFVSATELRTTITAAEVANGGTLLVRVFN
ncbi:MAG: hypothetical protein HOP19_03320, partial [Acidobacteria bacterium]|nr:hypothetical protein [Acidobacteriota bacterium]